MHYVQDQRQGVIVANRGFTELADNGDRFLVLLNGRRYVGIRRASCDIAVSTATRCASTGRDEGILSVAEIAATRQLLRDPRLNLSELAWRVGLPVSL